MATTAARAGGSGGGGVAPVPPLPSAGSSSSIANILRGQEPIPSLLNHYRGHKGPITSLCFHPNLQTVFSSSVDSYIMCWNYRKEKRALRFEGHCGPVNEIGLSKYGDLMISASDDCTVRVWVPIISGQYLTVKGHTGAVKSACFNPVDSTMFATGSNDKTIKVWSVQAAKMKSGVTKFKSHDFIRSFKAHNNWIRSVRFSPNGNLLVSSSDDKSIKVFDVRSKGEAVVTFDCDLGCPTQADFNPCGNSYIGVSSNQNSFLIYDVRQPKLLQSYVNLFAKAVTGFSFHPSGDFAVCISEEPKIKILDLVEGRPIFTLYGPRKGLYASAFNPSGSLFATGGRDEEVLIWEPTLLPYATEGEREETEGKENIAGGSGSGGDSGGTGSGEKKSSVSKSGSKTKVVEQVPQIVKSNSKSVSLESLSRTSSARSVTSPSAQSTS